jgi:hypothetical protein
MLKFASRREKNYCSAYLKVKLFSSLAEVAIQTSEERKSNDLPLHSHKLFNT